MGDRCVKMCRSSLRWGTGDIGDQSRGSSEINSTNYYFNIFRFCWISWVRLWISLNDQQITLIVIVSSMCHIICVISDVLRLKDCTYTKLWCKRSNNNVISYDIMKSYWALRGASSWVILHLNERLQMTEESLLSVYSSLLHLKCTHLTTTHPQKD